VGRKDLIVRRNSGGAKSFTATGVSVSYLFTMIYNTNSKAFVQPIKISKSTGASASRLNLDLTEGDRHTILAVTLEEC